MMIDKCVKCECKKYYMQIIRTDSGGYWCIKCYNCNDELKVMRTYDKQEIKSLNKFFKQEYGINDATHAAIIPNAEFIDILKSKLHMLDNM